MPVIFSADSATSISVLDANAPGTKIGGCFVVDSNINSYVGQWMGDVTLASGGTLYLAYYPKLEDLQADIHYIFSKPEKTVKQWNSRKEGIKVHGFSDRD